jgi:hypothetical protein
MIKYELTSQENENSTMGIRLTEGQFEGVEFRYGTINPIEENDQLQLTFEYEVLNSANHDKKELDENSDFIQLMGDLIVQILEEQIAKENGENL